MDEYRVKETGEVKTRAEIVELNSNASLPEVWDLEVCEALGIDPVLAVPKPGVSAIEIAVRNGAKLDGLGNWIQVWAVRPKFNDYVDEQGASHTVASQIQADKSRKASQAAESKKQQIEQEFKQACAQLKSGYTQEEVDSWPQQIFEAVEYLKDNAAETMMLSGIAAGKAVAVADLVNHVIVKKNEFSKFYGEALGAKNTKIRALNTLDTSSENILALISEI